MKITEFRKLLREEVQKVLKEAMETDTIVLVISYNGLGSGTFHKDSIFKGPYKGPKTFNIKTIRLGGMKSGKDGFQIIPAMSLNSFSIFVQLAPGEEQDVYNRAIKVLDGWFKTIKDDKVVYDDRTGLVVTFENANDLKKQTMNAIKANWKTTWAAKSPKFNLKP